MQVIQGLIGESFQFSNFSYSRIAENGLKLRTGIFVRGF